VQVPLDRARAEEELRADLLIRLPVSGEPRDLLLLRGELAACLITPFAHLLAVASSSWRVRSAAAELGIPVESGAPAEGADLITVGARVTFRHPLLRSAIYHAAPPNERRNVHRALASATDPEADPDRRAWHRAHAAIAPDEEVALELELSAGRAQARGGIAAAAAFLQRAVVRTVDPARRAERALSAAQASLEAGAFDAALGVLGTAEAGPLDEFQRARHDLVRGRIASASSFGIGATQLLKAAEQLELLDVDLARQTYLEAWAAAAAAGEFASAGTLRDISRAVCAAPKPAHEPLCFRSSWLFRSRYGLGSCSWRPPAVA
jgi:hypothetical protein